MSLNEEDKIDQTVTMSTHDFLLIFTDKGKVYRIKGYKIPEASRNAKGIPVINIINIEKDEKIKSLVPIDKEAEISGYLFFVTKQGICKRVAAHEFESIRQNGKIAITLKEDDELIGVKPTKGDEDIIIAASNGKAVRFREDCVRDMGRTASGVRGMDVDGSEVIGVATSNEGSKILIVTENGNGKKTDINEYRVTSRGAKGVKTLKENDRIGKLVALKAINGDEDALIMTSDGIIIRIHLDQVSELSRVTSGVRLITPQPGTTVQAVSIVEHEDEEEIIEETKEEGSDN